MGREVSLFSDYHSKENSLTNYCGLILKLLYREHPESFAEVVTSLVDDEIDLTIGPVFRQQKKASSSIPDLSIVQRAFAIFFETKLDDWFYSDQIRRHMEGLSDKAELRILFLLCNFETDARWPSQGFVFVGGTPKRLCCSLGGVLLFSTR